MHNDINVKDIGKHKEIESDTSHSLKDSIGMFSDTNSEPKTYDLKSSDIDNNQTVEYYDDTPEGYTEYIAKDGDTLEKIAAANNMSVEELKQVNTDLMDDNIDEGVRLFVPLEDNIIDDGGSKNIDDLIDSSDQESKSDSNNDSYESTNNPNNNDTSYLSTIKNNFFSKVNKSFSKFKALIGTFTRIYDFANEKGYDLSYERDVEAAIDSFIKDNQEYSDIDTELLKTMILNNNKLKSKNETTTTKDYMKIELKDYYESNIKSLLVQIGYNESELEEYSPLDILELVNNNKETIDQLLKNKISINNYDINELIYSYVLYHYKGLIPTNENFDSNEVIENYKKEAIDILSKLGYDLENLNEMNIYELINELVSNESKINQLFADYGTDIFMGDTGFGNLVTEPLANISYQLATEDRSMLAQYINANNYSEETKNNCLDYFDDGNVNSAIYTLKLEDLNKEEIYNSNMIKTLAEQINEIIINNPDYTRKIELGYTYEDIVNNMSEDNSELKNLLILKSQLEARNNEIGNEKYQTKTAIKSNSYQYLENLRKSAEYKKAIEDSNGRITYNTDTLDAILDKLNGDTVNNINDLVDYSLTNDLVIIEGVVKDYSLDYADDINLLSELIINDYKTMPIKKSSSIESVTREDDKIIVTVIHDDKTVKMIYDLTDGSYTYELGNESTLNNYNDINYFELFKYLMSQEKYKDMTKEEMLTEAFGYNNVDMMEYNDPFKMAQLAYLYLSEEEIDDYIYLYKTEGQIAANKYLEVKRDNIHQIQGMNAALEDIKYIMSGNKTFRTGIVGLENGVDGWADNVYAFFTKDTTMTPTEYESEYLLSLFASYATPLDLSDEELDEEVIKNIDDLKNATYLDYAYAKGEITEEEYKNLKNNENYKKMIEYIRNHPNKIRYSYMIGQNVGNMLPSVLGSVLFAPLGGITIGGHFIGAGQTIAGLLLYAGAYGGSYKEAIRNGHEESRANLYATLSALSEVATEYFLGRIPGVGRISESINPAIYQNIGQLLGMRGINLIKDIGGEILEESLQIWIDYTLKRGILGEEIDLSGWPEEQIDTMIVTTFSTLILGIPSNITTLTTDMSKGPIIKLKDNQELQLSFKDILRLNKEYVNSETGKIDIEGLQKEINELIKDNPYIKSEIQSNKIIIEPTVMNYYDYSDYVSDAPYLKEINGTRFASQTEEGLQKLIDFYENCIKEDEHGEYYKNVLSGKSLIITDIPNKLNSRSYHTNGIVYFDNKTINNKTSSTLFHELGHFLDYYSNNKFEYIYEDFIRKVSVKDVSQSTNLSEIAQALQQLNPNAEIRIKKSENGNENVIYTDVLPEFLEMPRGFHYNSDDTISNKYFTDSGLYTEIKIEDIRSIDEESLQPKFDINNMDFREVLQKAISKYETEFFHLTAMESLNKKMFEEEAINKLIENNPLYKFLPQVVLRKLTTEETRMIEFNWVRKQLRENGLAALSDIIDAITQGKWDSIAYQGFVIFGHGENYYKNEISKYKETLANIAAIYHRKKLDILYECFPKEYVDKLIDAYEELLDIEKVKANLNLRVGMLWKSLNEEDKFINSNEDMKKLHLYEVDKEKLSEKTLRNYERYFTFQTTANKMLDTFSTYYDKMYLGKYYISSDQDLKYNFDAILKHYLETKEIPDETKKLNPTLAVDLKAFLDLQSEDTINRFRIGG